MGLTANYLVGGGVSHNYTIGYLDAIKQRLLSGNPNCSSRASVSEVHLRVHETVLIVHQFNENILDASLA
jgi:hypothetical protein